MKYKHTYLIYLVCVLIGALFIGLLMGPQHIDLFTQPIDVNYYVISMQTPDRLKNIQEQQQKFDSKINIFDAVNGDNIDFDKIDGQELADSFKENTQKRKREIGCFLSHYNILKLIETTSNPDGYTVIFEDDFNIIVDNVELKIKTTLEDMKSIDFDMLYIEMNADQTGGESTVQGVCKMNMEQNMWGTQGYIVKNKNIRRMLENTWIIDMPIDWKYITAIKSNKLTAYTFCPFLSKSDNHASTIAL